MTPSDASNSIGDSVVDLTAGPRSPNGHPSESRLCRSRCWIDRVSAEMVHYLPLCAFAAVAAGSIGIQEFRIDRRPSNRRCAVAQDWCVAYRQWDRCGVALMASYSNLEPSGGGGVGFTKVKALRPPKMSSWLQRWFSYFFILSLL